MYVRIRAMLGGTAMVVGAIALAGCDNPTSPDHPNCLRPAPLLGSYDPAAPGFIVVYRNGVDAVAETKVLAAKYQFTPTSVWTAALQGFAAEMSPQAVAAVRCEPSVLDVEHNALVYAF